MQSDLGITWCTLPARLLITNRHDSSCQSAFGSFVQVVLEFQAARLGLHTDELSRIGQRIGLLPPSGEAGVGSHGASPACTPDMGLGSDITAGGHSGDNLPDQNPYGSVSSGLAL